MDEYYRAVRALPAWLARPLSALPPDTAEQVHEIRLREISIYIIKLIHKQLVLFLCNNIHPAVPLTENLYGSKESTPWTENSAWHYKNH